MIHNGVDLDLFRPDEAARSSVRAELGLDDSAVLIGLLARFHPMKDHAGFLRAAGVIAREHPKIRILLAGSGVTWQEPLLQNLISQERLEKQIFLLGERADIPAITAALDIACSASAWAPNSTNRYGAHRSASSPRSSRPPRTFWVMDSMPSS